MRIAFLHWLQRTGTIDQVDLNYPAGDGRVEAKKRIIHQTAP